MKKLTDQLRTWAEIDLDAVLHNFRAAKARLPRNTKLLAVLKANAYGHGSVRIGKLLEGEADYFAVAFTAEALELRHAGIKTPILILGHVPTCDFPLLVQYDITATVDSLNEAKLLSDTAVSAGKPAKLHIAIDTGMSRIGFPCGADTVVQIAAIAALPMLEIEGIFSHFATADSADKSYTMLQLRKFNALCDALNAAGIAIPIRHIQNSAGIVDLDCSFEMAREGIILYGMHPSSEVDLAKIGGVKPVMSLRTHVVHLATLPAGTPVSYGCTYVTTRETKVATLSVGYADGYPRLLSGKGKVIINGREVPLIGRICMDQCMADVTDLPEVALGAVATLFGSDGDCCISQDSLAESIGTIGYELVCNINPRVPRVFIQNGQFDSVDQKVSRD